VKQLEDGIGLPADQLCDLAAVGYMQPYDPRLLVPEQDYDD